VSVFILVTARMASSRYPGKAVVPLAGRPLLAVLLDRMKEARGVDGVALATTRLPEDDLLARIGGEAGVQVFRGETDDVLKRHIDCAREVGADHVVRVTGDNPLTDLETLEGLVALHARAGAEYTYVPGSALLMGILSEVISREALERSWESGGVSHRGELVTLFIKEHPGLFRIATGTLPEGLLHPELRLTVDEPEDVALMQAVFERLGGGGRKVHTRDAIELLLAEEGLRAINGHLRHKAANLRSVALDTAIVEGRP
jgi:spore coat polysaccharide biosynthesis protein SpsF (cytidylyltransferase family)